MSDSTSIEIEQSVPLAFSVRMSPPQAVLATVSYADVFDMPIDLQRVHRFAVGAALSEADVEAAASTLVAEGLLGRRGELLHLADRAEVLAVHDERLARAATMWDQAERWGRRIGRLPFVRMVAVTGGLAVDSVADHDDIDFFIITRPDRLWLTRLMILVLGRFAEREDVELCPNFIVSERAIALEDETLYAARELAQMVVLVGVERCCDLRRRNEWMFEYLPNATVEGDESRALDLRVTWWQRAAEGLLATRLFDPLEDWERERKIAKLRTVRSRRPEVGAPDESSFSAEVCKGHMVGNSAGIDQAWRDRLARYRR